MADKKDKKVTAKKAKVLVDAPDYTDYLKANKLGKFAEKK